jgi:hypothetical protein
VSTYTGADIATLAQADGADAPLARIMGAAAMAEGLGNSDAQGDWNGSDYTSWGAFQINDIHGLSRGFRCDLTLATQWMYSHEFASAYQQGLDRGYADEQLARWTCMRAARPWGWNGTSDPGLDSPAAENYARHWRDLAEPPSPENPDTPDGDYNPDVPRIPQTDAWSCSVATSAWMLQSLGFDAPYPALEQEMLDAHLVSRGDGLLFGNGQDLEPWLENRTGMPADRAVPAGWPWVWERAGTGPIALGGHRWGNEGHWVAVRGRDEEAGVLLLANPADGYAGIHETLSEAQFRQVAPCTAICIPATHEEDPVVIEQLRAQIVDAENLLSNIQGAWIDAVVSAIEDAKADEDPESRNAKLDAALAATNTIKNGG